MNKRDKVFLRKSLNLLEQWLHADTSFLLEWLDQHQRYAVEEGSYTYCLFSYPCYLENKELPSSLEHCILLVYDQDQVIADMAGYIDSMEHICFNSRIKEYICRQSDWTDLEQYILEQLYGSDSDLNQAPALIITNAYVTKAYRLRHIFSTMENMAHDYVLSDIHEQVIYYSIISLDPDVACYGPDTPAVPYIYTFDKDEPIRRINAGILSRLGYRPIRLEADEISDGTKLWFAVKKEADTVIDSSVSVTGEL